MYNPQAITSLLNGDSLRDYYIKAIPAKDLHKWAVIPSDAAISESDEYGGALVDRLAVLDKLIASYKEVKGKQNVEKGADQNNHQNGDSLSHDDSQKPKVSMNEKPSENRKRHARTVVSNGFEIHYTGTNGVNESSLIRELLAISEDEVDHSPSPLNPGLHILMGKAGIGKSKVISDLASSCMKHKWSVSVIRAAEPDFRAHCNGFMALQFAIIDSRPIVLIDSIRDLLYISGNLIEGGVSAQVFDILTAVSSFAMRMKKTIVAVINPTNPSQSVYDNLTHIMKSSCTGVFDLSSKRGDKRVLIQNTDDQSKWYYLREQVSTINEFLSVDSNATQLVTDDDDVPVVDIMETDATHQVINPTFGA